MDTLTHGIAGALLARAMPLSGIEAEDRILRRRETWLGFLAAMSPDADALLSPFSADFYITQHRGLSHSFPMLPFWAVLLGLAATWRLPPLSGTSRAKVGVRLSVVAAIGLASHILLDWITSWGTMFLSPFSWERYTLDWVFIIDFALSGILLLGLAGTLVVASRSAARGRFAAIASLAAATAYIGFCGLRHEAALGVAAKLLPRGAARAAIPQPLSPDRWLLLADDGRDVFASFVDLSRHGRGAAPPAPDNLVETLAASPRSLLFVMTRMSALYRSPDDARTRVIPKADGPMAAKLLAEGASGVFGRFARFPAAHGEKQSDGETRVVLRDVRFGYLSSRIDPFTYVARYGPTGELLFAGFPSERWGGAVKR